MTVNEANWKGCRVNDLMYDVLTVSIPRVLACKICA